MKAKYIIVLLVLIMAGSAFAQSGTSLGLANAYTTFARGSEAIFWNPANLGFREIGRPLYSVTLFAFDLGVSNNSVSLQDYEDWFTDENLVLTESDKDQIIGLIDDDGLKVNFNSNASIMAMAYKNFGMSFTMNGFGEVKAPKDLFRNALRGLEQKVYNYATTVDGEAVSSMNFAYGQVVKRDYDLNIPVVNRIIKMTEIAVGGTFKYNMGLMAFETSEMNFTTDIRDDGIRVNGRFIGKGTRFIREFDPNEDTFETEFDDEAGVVGTGFGLDLAVSAKTSTDYMLSLVVKNVFNRTKWTESVLQFDQAIDTGDPKFFVGDGQLEDLEEEDYRTDLDKEIDSFTTTRPFGFRLAIGREVGRYKYAVEVGHEDEKKVLAFGGGIRWAIFNVFGGYGYKYGNNFNAGLGIGGDHLMFDIGIGSKDGFTPNTSEGVIIASSLKFGF